MDESDFEGTLVLEKMAAINKLDEFFEAIDADDFDQVKRLLKRAHVDLETTALVVKKMQESDGKH